MFCERLHITIDDELRGPVRWQFTGGPVEEAGGGELNRRLAELGDERDNPSTAFLTAVSKGTAADPDFAAAVPSHKVVDAIYASAAADGDVVRSVEV